MRGPRRQGRPSGPTPFSNNENIAFGRLGHAVRKASEDEEAEEEPNYSTEGPGDDAYYDYDNEEWVSEEDDQGSA